jgi:hypothetical protein
MTVIQIVNKVLRRLRESQITSLSETEYASMVTDFLVDTHKDLLDYDWSSMEHTVEVPIDPNQRILDLSRLEANSGDILAGSALPTTESIPLWAKWFTTSTDTQGFELSIITNEEIDQDYYLDTGIRSQNLESVAFRGHPSRDGIEATLYPIPNVARHMRVRFWTPEAEIDVTTDTNRTVLVPWRPLYLGTLYLALNERGEEIGEPGGLAEKRFYKAVETAKEADQNRKNNADRYVAQRV